MTGEPYIPQFLTVHLGAPGSNAQNVTVSFPDYIKNVASSEIYPTWPENAIRANVYAQISYALNRFYTEWYRSMGYDFDITNSTRYDQAYVQNRDIFANVSDIVDDIFNEYVYRQGSVEPYFTQYCNGTTVTCDGLSQWGTVPLAEQGYGPYDILVEFYGPDINLNTDTPVRTNTPSYPGLPCGWETPGTTYAPSRCSSTASPATIPASPRSHRWTVYSGRKRTMRYREFQRIFKLTADGIIGKATWYRIAYLYTSIKRLSELDSEGISLDEVSQQFPSLLSPGDTGDEVRMIQYYLRVVAAYYDTVPPLTITGVYDDATYQTVIAFQRTFGLTPDGIMGQQTWNELYRAYRGILDSTSIMEGGVVLYPGTVLRIGSQGEYVQILQEYLAYISETYPGKFRAVQVTGVFGNQTQAGRYCLSESL